MEQYIPYSLICGLFNRNLDTYLHLYIYYICMVTGKFSPKQISPWKTPPKLNNKFPPAQEISSLSNFLPRKSPLNLKFLLPSTSKPPTTKIKL